MSICSKVKSFFGKSSSISENNTGKLDYELCNYYTKLWNTVKIKQNKKSTVYYYINRILDGKDAYKNVEMLSGVPWQIVGCIHAMESSYNFNTHLHNGDLLSDRTTREPVGRPTKGNPPFTWIESAIDALMLKKADKINFKSIPETLNFMEGYNGYGYRMRGINSPYLWSFTNHYTRGKYIRDVIFNPLAVSKQCGVCAILLKLEQKGMGLWQK